jgi:hypothetical protein
VYYSILVIIEYAIPLLVMTVAYIKMGRQLWGAKTPGQVRLHNAKIKCFYFSYLGHIFLTPNQRKAVFWPTFQTSGIKMDRISVNFQHIFSRVSFKGTFL